MVMKRLFYKLKLYFIIYKVHLREKYEYYLISKYLYKLPLKYARSYNHKPLSLANMWSLTTILYDEDNYRVNINNLRNGKVQEFFLEKNKSDITIISNQLDSSNRILTKDDLKAFLARLMQQSDCNYLEYVAAAHEFIRYYKPYFSDNFKELIHQINNELDYSEVRSMRLRLYP